MLSYNQEGAILQYFICNKNAIRVRKMPLFLRAKQGLKGIKISRMHKSIEHPDPLLQNTLKHQQQKNTIFTLLFHLSATISVARTTTATCAQWQLLPWPRYDHS